MRPRLIQPGPPGPRLPACEPRRFLILSASMGAGHDTVAAALGDRLTAAGHQVSRADVLDLLPAGLGGVIRSFYHLTISHLPALYAGIYQVFFRDGSEPRPGGTPLSGLACDRLLALTGQCQPDVVVSVFHLAAQVAGRLRARGALTVPSAVVVTDFAVHRQWLHPGNDLHLCLAAPVAGQVARSAGRPAVACGPLVAERFTTPPSPGRVAWWRRCLAGGDRPVILLSTGAWGAASRVAQTVRLLAGAGYRPVVLCGKNERLRDDLSALPGAVVLGWVDDMPALLGAADVLIDNAAGQTALQALAAGLPVVGYRPIPGHGAEGVRRMADLGLTDYARAPRPLLRSLAALSTPGPYRRQRIAAGRGLFDAGADGVACLESLAGPRRDLPRRGLTSAPEGRQAVRS
jgi:UDP-N-acetylglucosamine:LPS N-acetylglucosamine transferase